LGLVGLLVVFYMVPVDGLAWSGRTVASVAFTLLGVVCLAWAITGQLRRQRTSASEASLQSLVMLLELVAVVFALGYYLIELASPSEIAGLRTRTDALYFTVSTLSTIGFGDVHAMGQLARALVLVQMVFDVVFVAAVASTLSGRFRSRMDV
jgi:hypothetical protein